MSESDHIVDTQLKHLLAVVEQRRSERCSEVLDRARQEAQLLIKQAYREARQRMHRELGEIRQKRRQQLVSVVAQRQTRRRLRQQRLDEELLTTTWVDLREALRHRWQDSLLREQWVEALVNLAASVLVDRHWVLSHPSDWSAQERSALQLRLQKQLDATPQFQASAKISAGLRICAGGACVDGTVDGLLHERLAIEAILLAKINEFRGGQD